MRKKILLSMIAAALIVLFPAVFLAQSAERIVQSITVNGQPAQGVLVIQDGVVQSVRCSAPEPYVTTDNSDRGWACFDDATGTWLLHAQSPATVYSGPTTVYAPSYVYPYPVYPYFYRPYPFFWGPTFGLGFGFNFGHGFHDHFGGHGFHGGGFRGGGFHGGGFHGGHMGGGHR